jgi:maltooligosyltrehalose trehalohydrolase
MTATPTSPLLENDRPSIGAMITERGVCYRVWAPRHPTLDVRIRRRGENEVVLHAMERVEHGYFEYRDEAGRSGDRYQFGFASGKTFPDPASRYQPDGVHGESECVDARAYPWKCDSWQRPGWRGQSIYELHVGTFTQEGTFRSAIERLDHLVELGVEAVELMPVADFPGQRNWGYDGVALFAPARCYGKPDDLRALIDAAHARGLTMILDVVYNHLGPDGNYLTSYAENYFHRDRETPWGTSFNLDGDESGPVRNYFLSNVAYWLDDFRFDGLRLDATHMIHDASARHLLAEIADEAHRRGAFLIAEDERNTSEILRQCDGKGAGIDAAWADDFHHQVRVALTGTTEGYFKGYRGTAEDLATTIRRGWFYSGQPYAAWQGRPRGDDPEHLPTKSFVVCIENHDQVGNRALGERLEHLIDPLAYRAAVALLCLSPLPPMLFMGQEWAASSPFLYFTDHEGELGRLVSVGRQKEFSRAGLNQHLRFEQVPDPQATETFTKSKLAWSEIDRGEHAHVFALHRASLQQRKRWLHGAATERSAWIVEAMGDAVVIRYDSPGQPSRLLVSLLRGDTRISAASLDRFALPREAEWRVLIDSVSPLEPEQRVPTELKGPVTLLLEASQRDREGAKHA